MRIAGYRIPYTVSLALEAAYTVETRTRSSFWFPSHELFRSIAGYLGVSMSCPGEDGRSY